MKKQTKFILKLFSVILSVIPPTLATIYYFPLWADQGGGATVSGLVLLLLTISILPLLRIAKNALKSPNPFLLWIILFILFLCLSKIAEQCIVISFFGALGSLSGAFLFNIAKLGGKNE